MRIPEFWDGVKNHRPSFVLNDFFDILLRNLARKCEFESESENKKSEALALAPALTLFVVPSGLEPELF